MGRDAARRHTAALVYSCRGHYFLTVSAGYLCVSISAQSISARSLARQFSVAWTLITFLIITYFAIGNTRPRLKKKMPMESLPHLAACWLEMECVCIMCFIQIARERSLMCSADIRDERCIQKKKAAAADEEKKSCMLTSLCLTYKIRGLSLYSTVLTSSTFNIPAWWTEIFVALKTRMLEGEKKTTRNSNLSICQLLQKQTFKKL